MHVTTVDVERRMMKLRGQFVLLDTDVAELYGVETKRVNEAVRNNPQKFPYGYIFELDKYEKIKCFMQYTLELTVKVLYNV